MATRSAMKRKPRQKAESNAPQPLQVRLTHPDRVVYAEQGITKRDLANYYVAISQWILPHVTGRPLVLVRCPEGAQGDCFYQKHPPVGLPAAVDRIAIREKTKTQTYVAIHDLAGLVSLVQFGTLEIHAWGARVDDIEHPDRMVFDLDPDPTVSWKQVIATAILLRDTLQRAKLQSFVKTTGGKGLHLVVPLEPRHLWAEVKQFAKGVADAMVRADPKRYIATMSKAARRGKIFIDYLRNERGATSVVPYSTRAKAGAAVSAPITWRELPKLTNPRQFTVENVPQRLSRLRRDPWHDLDAVDQHLPP